MFKNFKKRSRKAQIFIISVMVIILALVAFVLYASFKPEPPVEYEMAQVKYNDMTEILDVSGKVETDIQDTFDVVEGVKPKEIFVNVGDKVSKGDKLATFDVSGAQKYLNAVKNDYDKAVKDYNDTKSQQEINKQKKKDLTEQINSLKESIDKLKEEIETLEIKLEQEEATDKSEPVPQSIIEDIVLKLIGNGATDEHISKFRELAGQILIPSTNKESSTQKELMNKKIKLAELSSQLAALTAESASIVEIDSDTVLKSLKTVVDVKKAYYDNINSIFNKMKKGWIAENDGIVTVVSIEKGVSFVPVVEEKNFPIDITSLLGGYTVDSSTATMIASLLGSSTKVPMGQGIVVEGYDNMTVTVTVGKSDLLKIKKGMSAKVISLDKEYDGEVIYVGATATESETLDLGSIAGSIMGSSGSGGAIVKVKINNPDEKVVIGFDVDIKIELSTISDVLTIPVESVLYNSGEYSVFVFDEDKKTVEKKKIEKGMLDDKSYQIIDGLKENDKVLMSPDPDMLNGTRVKEKTE